MINNFAYYGYDAANTQTQQRLATRIMQVDQDFRAELLELVEAGDVPVEFPNVLNLITLLPAGSNANSNPNPNSNSNSNPHSNANTSNDIFYYHTNHLGSTAFVTDANATITQGFLYAPFGEITTEYNANFGNNVLPKYSFNAKELDEETGMYYYEARYMAPPTFISRDPMFEKYFWITPYAYCANNPVKYVDPSGREYGDYYSASGKWLGTDGIDDNKAYVATGKSSNGSFFNAKELPISNTELLDRATWVCGESGGSQEQITSRTINAGDATSIGNAGVSDYYAFAINNASIADGGFYKAVNNRMGKMINGQYKRTGEGYFKGNGLGGNSNSKAFANARALGMEAINSDPRFTNSIAAVIKSVTSPVDPTGGCRAWLGSSCAISYVNSPQKVYSYNGKKAVVQFSFSSGNNSFNHTFYRLH